MDEETPYLFWFLLFTGIFRLKKCKLQIKQIRRYCFATSRNTCLSRATVYLLLYQPVLPNILGMKDLQEITCSTDISWPKRGTQGRQKANSLKNLPPIWHIIGVLQPATGENEWSQNPRTRYFNIYMYFCGFF